MGLQDGNWELNGVGNEFFNIKLQPKLSLFGRYSRFNKCHVIQTHVNTRISSKKEELRSELDIQISYPGGENEWDYGIRRIDNRGLIIPRLKY